MLPLQWVAAGLAVVVLDVLLDGWDLLPDWAGWLLAGAATHTLRDRLGPAPPLLALLSAVVAVVDWVPGVLEVSDASLAWALSLPQAAFVVVVCLTLAGEVPDRARALRAAAWTNAAFAAIPVLVLGGGLTVLLGPLAFAAVAALLWVCWLLVAVAPGLTPRDPPPG